MSDRLAYVSESEANDEIVMHGFWLSPLERCHDGDHHHFGTKGEEARTCDRCDRKLDDHELNADHPLFADPEIQLRWLDRSDHQHWTIGLFRLFESAGKTYVGGMVLIKPTRSGLSWRVLNRDSWEWTQQKGSLLDVLEACVEKIKKNL